MSLAYLLVVVCCSGPLFRVQIEWCRQLMTRFEHRDRHINHLEHIFCRSLLVVIHLKHWQNGRNDNTLGYRHTVYVAILMHFSEFIAFENDNMQQYGIFTNHAEQCVWKMPCGFNCNFLTCTEKLASMDLPIRFIFGNHSADFSPFDAHFIV